MKKKIVGIFVCTLLIATTVLPVAGSEKVSRQEWDYEAGFGLVCCCSGAGLLNYDELNLKEGCNWIKWKKVVFDNCSFCCVGAGGWFDKSNYIGYIKHGCGHFKGNLTIRWFWGIIIWPNNVVSSYILTGIGVGIKYRGAKPIP